MLGLIPPRARRFAPQRVNSLALPTLTNHLSTHIVPHQQANVSICQHMLADTMRGLYPAGSFSRVRKVGKLAVPDQHMSACRLLLQSFRAC